MENIITVTHFFKVHFCGVLMTLANTRTLAHMTEELLNKCLYTIEPIDQIPKISFKVLSTHVFINFLLYAFSD